MNTLSGRVAVVSGGGSGIGLATCERLARSGALVESLDLDPKLSGHHRQTVDVTNADSVQKAVTDVLARRGRIDIAITAAGVGGAGHVAELDIDHFNRTLAVNLQGTLLLARAVLPAMLERGSGAIVTIGSTFGLLARPGLTPYCVSKAAVVHLTRCMAIDYAERGVRVNCVCPGLIDTPMTEYLNAADGRETKAMHAELHAMNRTGQPAEVAEAIAYLVSDAAAYVTGAILPVDGGYTAGKWGLGDQFPAGRAERGEAAGRRA